ncbi:MAG: hypothetical protein ACR2OD_08025, partial [Gaiellaceae bacterium]
MILLSPVVPSTGGTGLAMRAGVALTALSTRYPVHVLVVPVVGDTEPPDWALAHANSVTVAPLFTRETAAAGIMELLADPAWRTRLTATEPLPEPARRASPGLARPILARADLPRGTPLHVIRSYLAPLGVALADQLDSPWTTLDLDDDDEALLRDEGADEEAESYRRLIRVFGPSYRWCGLA